MTDGDFDAEEHRQWRKSRSWWNCGSDFIAITVIALTALITRKRRKKR